MTIRTIKPLVHRMPAQPTKRGPRLYNEARWRKTAATWLEYYPCCVLCLVRGRINQGAMDNQTARQRNLIVDHIAPHRGSSDLFWDQSNWQTLCRMPCHDQDKQRHEAAGRNAEQWYQLLRAVMQQNKTEQTVQEMQHWLPAHIVQALGGV